MSDLTPAAATVKLSLWKAGIESFRQHWRQWLPLGIIFFCLAVVANGSLNHYLLPLQAQLQILNSQKNPQLTLEFFKTTAPLFSALGFAFFFVVYAQHYLFLSFFTVREFPMLASPPSLRQFLCFLSKGLQFIGLLLVPPLLCVLLLASLLFMLKTAKFLVVILALITVGLQAYLVIRLFFVMVLASGQITAPIKHSWRLTDGNGGRIFGNALMVILILAASYFLISVGVFLVLMLLGFAKSGALLKLSDTATVVIQYGFAAGFQILTAGVFAAFSARACRILYDEKSAADPGFTLIKRL